MSSPVRPRRPSSSTASSIGLGSKFSRMGKPATKKRRKTVPRNPEKRYDGGNLPCGKSSGLLQEPQKDDL